MQYLWQSLDTEMVILFSALAVLIVGGGCLIQMVRTGVKEQKSDTHGMLTNFREMYARGELSEEEYRTIKGELSEKIREEVNHDENQAQQKGE